MLYLETPVLYIPWNTSILPWSISVTPFKTSVLLWNTSFVHTLKYQYFTLKNTSVVPWNTSVLPWNTSFVHTLKYQYFTLKNTSVVPWNTSIAPWNTSIVPWNTSVVPWMPVFYLECQCFTLKHWVLYLEISVESVEEDLRGEKVLHHADEHAPLPVGDPVEVVLVGGVVNDRAHRMGGGQGVQVEHVMQVIVHHLLPWDNGKETMAKRQW